VTYKNNFGLDDWIYCTLHIHTARDYRKYSAIADIHTFQFTVTHAIGYSVFTIRILATDLAPFYFNFKSHMKSSLRCLITFLPFLLNRLALPSPELDPIPVPSRLLHFTTTVLYSHCTLFLLPRRTLLITTSHGPHGKHRLLLSRMRFYWCVT
jgi:hypothetical protein